MNWLPFLDSLYAALSQTLETICPGNQMPCNEIQHRFNLLSAEVLLNFNGRCPPAAGSWQAMFQMLRRCLTTHFESLARAGVPLDRKVCKDLDTLVLKIRALARKHAGELWPAMSPAWDAVMLKAQRMTKECEVEFGNANMQTIYYFSGEYTVENLKALGTIKNRAKGISESSDAALAIAISDMRFGIRLNAIVNGDSVIQRRYCERLRKWAEKKRQEIELAEGTFIPTLTSGLPCLLPKNARETVAVLKKKHQDKSLKKNGYIVGTLVSLFGEEAIPYFDLDFFIQNGQSRADRKHAFRVLGSIGGPQAVEVLCGLFWVPTLCEEALKVMEKLAIPMGVVGLPDERPGRFIEKIVRLILDNLEQLKQQNRASRRLIERVEKKVRTCHKPI